jgi:hypothetical protein
VVNDQCDGGVQHPGFPLDIGDLAPGETWGPFTFPSGPCAEGTVNTATVVCDQHSLDEELECLPPTDDATCSCDDGFKCYKVKEPGRRTFEPVTRPLVDQFGDSFAKVLTPFELCAPASKNQEPVGDPNSHLLCYKIRSFGERTTRFVTDEDQFGPEELRVGSAVEFCVPAVKNNEGVAIENNYQCYQARGNPPIGPFEAVLEDQFETKTTDLIRTSLHCNPVLGGDDVGALVDPNRHLKCYDIADADGQARFPGAFVTTEDQFGPLSLQVGRPTRFCEPACKNDECGEPGTAPQ